MSDQMQQEKLKLSNTEGDEAQFPEPQRIPRRPLSTRLNEFNHRLTALLNEFTDLPPFMRTGLLIDLAIQPTIVSTVQRAYGVQEENPVQEEARNSGGGEVQGRNEGPRLVDTETPRERVPGGTA